VTITDFDKIGASRLLGFTALLAVAMAGIAFVDAFRAALRRSTAQGDLLRHARRGGDFLAVGVIYFVLVLVERGVRPTLELAFAGARWHATDAVPWAPAPDLVLSQHTPVLWLFGAVVSFGFVSEGARRATAWIWNLLLRNPWLLLGTIFVTGSIFLGHGGICVRGFCIP
jgi:hypothetical protein